MSIKYIKCIANYFKVVFFKIQPITVSAILIFLSSYVSGNGWVNKWPRKTIPDFPYFGILSIVLTIIVLLFWIVSTHLFYLMKFSIVNEVDTFLTSLFIISATNIWIFSFSNNQAESIMMTITLLTGSIICCRIKKIYDTSISNEIFESNKLSSSLVDLRDLYNKSNVTQNEHGEILVDEREVDYDLFDRSNIVKQLAEAMQHPTSKHSYVIGLTGIWGSGKSTILNLAKQRYKIC
jgi:ABC-type multidrug transport system fused ATPase/permease subunit